MCDFPALKVIKVHQKFIVKYSHSAQMCPDRGVWCPAGCGWHPDRYKSITLQLCATPQTQFLYFNIDYILPKVLEPKRKFLDPPLRIERVADPEICLRGPNDL